MSAFCLELKQGRPPDRVYCIWEIVERGLCLHPGGSETDCDHVPRTETQVTAKKPKVGGTGATSGPSSPIPVPAADVADAAGTDLSSGPASGKTLDQETRRHVHNVLERRRREDLKVCGVAEVGSFPALRSAVYSQAASFG